MSRKATKPAEIIDPATLESTAQWSESANALATLNQEQDALVRATALAIGYQLPADATDPDLIQRDIAVNMRRSVEACLEVGRGLTVLKSACLHGQFQARLGVLGIEESIARRFIHSASKFSNRATSHDLIKAIGGQSKLFEMLILDDEQIEELAEAGKTGALTIDDVERMSVKELRAAVRNLRSDVDAKDKVLDDTHKKLTKLQVQVKKKIAADTDWPDALTPITDQVAAAGRAIAKAISDLETCRITLLETGQELEADLQPKYEAALSHIVQVYETALGKAERDIQKERVTFDKSLGAYGA